MHKRAVRKGLRCILLALAFIIVVSFFHGGIAEVLALSYQAETGLYRFGIFCAAALGGFGVVQTVLGLLLPGNQRDTGVRLLPTFLLIVAFVSLFFYLFSVYIDNPTEHPRDRLRPGESITI